MNDPSIRRGSLVVWTNEELIAELQERGIKMTNSLCSTALPPYGRDHETDCERPPMGFYEEDAVHDPEVYGYPTCRPNGEPYPDQGYSSYPYD